MLYEVITESKVMPLRIAVFVVEQGVPMAMERDDDDPVSRHAWIEASYNFV